MALLLLDEALMFRCLRLALGAIAFFVCLRGASGADDAASVPDRGQFTVSAGRAFSASHLREGGVVSPPPVYLGAELQLRIHRMLGVGVVAGANFLTGWLLGVNARAEAHATDNLFLSGGIGPIFIPAGYLAGAVLVQTDATLSLRFANGGTLMIGPTLAVAAKSGGRDRCGVDTCDAWLARGGRLWTMRAGFGGAF